MNYKCKIKAVSGRPNVECACVCAGGERNPEAQDENLRLEESREARRGLREEKSRPKSEHKIDEERQDAEGGATRSSRKCSDERASREKVWVDQTGECVALLY